MLTGARFPVDASLASFIFAAWGKMSFSFSRKPKLEAQWTETILATPMKPGGHFPHSMVPNAKLKFAEKMSQSMTMLPLTTSMSTSESLALPFSL